MNYKFIINHNAGKGKLKSNLDSLLYKIRKHIPDYDYCITESINDLEKCAMSIQKYDVIVSVGGDGTINGILNKIIGKNVTLGILPVGSGNDLAYSLDIPKDIDSALETLKAVNTKLIDVGFVRTDKFERFFVNAVGIGFDAMVAERTNRINMLPNAIKYYYSLLESLLKYKSSTIKVDFDGKSFENKYFLITIGNGKRTGGAFLLTPEAILDDGKLDICLVENKAVSEVITALPKVLKGEHGSVDGVEFHKTNHLKIESTSPLYLHFDGDCLSKVKSIEIELKHNILNLIS